MTHIERKALQDNARALKRALASDPDDSKARVNLARTYLLLGLDEQAIREYTTLARQAIRLADFDRALAACRTILRIKPDLPMVVDMMAGLIARNPQSSGIRVVKPISEAQVADFMRREIETSQRAGTSTDDSWDLDIDASADASLEVEIDVDDETLDDLVDAAGGSKSVPLVVNDGIDDDWEVIEVEEADILLQSDDEIPVSPQNLMQQIPLFTALDLSTFVTLMRDVQVRRAPKDEWIYRDGDDLQSVYLIAAGRVALVKRDGFGEEQIVCELGVGDLLGEGLFCDELRYSESARVLERVELLVLTRHALGAAIAHAPHVQALIEQTHQSRSILRLIAASPLFRTLPLDVRYQLTEQFELALHPPASLILREGETAQQVMLIGFGDVEVVRQHEGETTIISRMSAGEALGLLSCLTDVPLNTTIRAVGEVHLYRLPKPVIVSLCETYEAFQAAADRAMAMRQLLVEAAGAPTN